MYRIREAIVVEGRYDKNALSQVVDTVILETSGFGIFKNDELMALLRRLTETRGIVVLTDSDGAGFLIRSRIRSCLPKAGVKHAYIPDIQGKERRKRAPGKEGLLGVEGMSPQVLLEALRRAGATFLGEGTAAAAQERPPITKADLFALGLSGGADASARRAALLQRLDLPAHMSANALLPVLNALYDRESFLKEAAAWR
ncbi:DUF4093 domain-containing protein [uncultured Intestinimonas sp.]|uniref:toprim domain-containing protein n=1 Tax=uncultured Intestinimonas sp. TaxID=1689265 RepID=UPI0025E86D1A|nr:DUF4093 domain-containing protein [uncultured Intestinimonas sp.]